MRTTIAVAVLTLGALPAAGQESAAPPAALLHGATIAVQLKKTDAGTLIELRHSAR